MFMKRDPDVAVSSWAEMQPHQISRGLGLQQDSGQNFPDPEKNVGVT